MISTELLQAKPEELDSLVEGAKKRIVAPPPRDYRWELFWGQQWHFQRTFFAGSSKACCCSHLRKGPSVYQSAGTSLVSFTSQMTPTMRKPRPREEKDPPMGPQQGHDTVGAQFFVLIKRRNFPQWFGFWRMRHKAGRSPVGTLKGKHPSHPPVPKACLSNSEKQDQSPVGSV